MLGIEPTAISACEPSTTRPSASSTRTPSAVRVTPVARDFDSTVMPRCMNTPSSTAAASASSPGSTRSREDTSVTSDPSSLYAEANSAPVTPLPTTISRCGSSARSYSCSQVRIRSPSGWAAGRMRGRAPVASSTTSADRSSSPLPLAVTRTLSGASSAPRPLTTRTPARSRLPATSCDCASASRLTRAFVAARSTQTFCSGT